MPPISFNHCTITYTALSSARPERCAVDANVLCSNQRERILRDWGSDILLNCHFSDMSLILISRMSELVLAWPTHLIHQKTQVQILYSHPSYVLDKYSTHEIQNPQQYNLIHNVCGSLRALEKTLESSVQWLLHNFVRTGE